MNPDFKPDLFIFNNNLDLFSQYNMSYDDLNSDSHSNIINLFGENEDDKSMDIDHFKKESENYIDKYSSEPIFMINKETIIKERKDMEDNMRKKIKSNFYKELKKKLNVKYGDFKFSQKMIINIAKEENKNNLQMSLKDVFISQNIKKNNDLFNNIRDNDDRILNIEMKYLFNEYLNSSQFQDSIKNLIKEGELFDYIHNYIQVSDNYISYFLGDDDKSIEYNKEFQIFDKAKEEEEDYKSLYNQEPIFSKKIINLGKRDSERKFLMRKRIRTKFYKLIIKKLNKNKEIFQLTNNKKCKFQQNMTNDKKNKEIFALSLEEVLKKNFFKIDEQNNETYNNLNEKDNEETDLEIKLNMKIKEIYEQFYKKGILVKELEEEGEFYDCIYEFNNEAKNLLKDN